jgi:teichuronic acid exporter
MSLFNRSLLMGTIWSMIGQMATLGIGLIANIFLARMLTPYQIGQVGIVMFFIALANILSESGLGGALIRKTEVTKEDYATAFSCNFGISAICFVLLAFFSGTIATYYKDKELQNILIVSSLIFILNTFQFVQHIKMSREMRFKSIAKYRLIIVFISSITGISLAAYGVGVWSLVIMQLTSTFLSSVIFCFYEGFYFTFEFNKKSFKELYAFGVNTTLASLLNSFFENIYQLILGRYFSINQVGFFYQAKRLQEVPTGIINMTTQSVIFSSLAKLQNEKELFRITYNKIVLVLTIVVGAITGLIYLYSENIIELLFGIKWIESAFYMKLLSIASFFYMQEMFNRIIFKVFNQTQKILYLELIKKSIQTITILIGVVKSDLTLLLYGLVLTSIISYFINFYYSRKILGNIDFIELIILLKVLFCSILTIAIVKIVILFFSLIGLYSLMSLPLFFLIYLFLIQNLKLLHIRNEFRIMLNLMKNN